VRRSLLHGGAAPLAIALFLALAGCDPTVAVVDDAVACEGVRCTAGTCYSNAGQPSCRCGPWEDSAGLLCQVAVFVTPDDHGGSPAEATPVSADDGPVEARISASVRGMADRDLFTFTVKPGHSYVFVCEFVSLVRCQPRLLDENGRHVSAFYLDGKRTSWLFTGLPEGTWYVEVSGEAGATGTYTYQLLDLGLDDFGDFPEASSTVDPSEAPFTVTSTFLADDDVIRFDVEPGHAYRFGCELPTPESGVVLRLMDGQGKVVDFAEGLGTRRVAQLELKATAKGAWFVKVSPTYGQTPLIFNCRLKDLGRDEHGDTAATATRLTPGVPVAVRMHSGKDVDELVFARQAGHHYVLRQQPVLPVDIQLLDSTGRRLGPVTPNTYLQLPAGVGTYHLKLTPPRTGASDEPFELLVEDLGPDDHGDWATGATRAPVGVPIPVLSHSSSDVDNVAFPAEPDGVYVTTCEPACEVHIYVLGSRNPAVVERVSTKHVNANDSAMLTFSFPGSRPEPFTVKVDRVGTDDHPGSMERASQRVLPVAVAGNFEAVNDLEVFTVALEAYRTYRVETSANAVVSFRGPGDTWAVPVDGRFRGWESGLYGVSVRLVDDGVPGPWSLRLVQE
jgi:hypothetical protein